MCRQTRVPLPSSSRLSPLPLSSSDSSPPSSLGTSMDGGPTGSKRRANPGSRDELPTGVQDGSTRDVSNAPARDLSLAATPSRLDSQLQMLDVPMERGIEFCRGQPETKAAASFVCPQGVSNPRFGL